MQETVDYYFNMAEPQVKNTHNKRNRGKGPQGRRPRHKQEREFDQRVVDLARVTRVTAGGKRMRFRACVVIGDRKGKVGYGVAKGSDVQASIQKAVEKAKKAMIRVPMVKDSIPHKIEVKAKAARIMMKPAPQGTGVIAGGAIRTVLELAGIKNISAKMLGSTNKHNNVHAAITALKRLQIASVKKNMIQKNRVNKKQATTKAAA